MNTWQPVTWDDPAAPQPRRLFWQGEAMIIVDYGRCWESARGRHQLVRVRDGRVFELLQTPSGWYALVHINPPGVV